MVYNLDLNKKYRAGGTRRSRESARALLETLEQTLRETRQAHRSNDFTRLAIPAAVGVGDVSPCSTSGRYACGDHAVADLRSGDPSNAVPTGGRGTLQVLADQPADFAWSTDRWTDASQTIKETAHRHEGVVRREFYSSSTLAKAHDLNAAGQAIRRVSYRDGQIAEREYYTSAGVRVSREILAPSGRVAETSYYARDDQTESAHWWFDRGQPVKLVRGGKTYVTRGDRFGRIDGDRFVDTPRGPYSE